MPTGYTAAIKDGITFERFLLDCARAFGACIELRDEPGGGEQIPERFEPSDYHIKALTEERAALAAVLAMTPAECERAAAKAYDDAETNRVMRLQEKAELRAAYETMLEKARKWTPPTDSHRGLREFMVSQIVESIRFDCGTSYYETPTVRKSSGEWLAAEIAAKKESIAYHQREHAAEVQRADERTAWVQALRQSLKGD